MGVVRAGDIPNEQLSGIKMQK